MHRQKVNTKQQKVNVKLNARQHEANSHLQARLALQTEARVANYASNAVVYNSLENLCKQKILIHHVSLTHHA